MKLTDEYIVIWEDDKGNINKSKIKLSLNEAAAWCVDMNKKYPKIKHWYEKK
jgi:hypothetical protein